MKSPLFYVGLPTDKWDKIAEILNDHANTGDPDAYVLVQDINYALTFNPSDEPITYPTPKPLSNDTTLTENGIKSAK